MVGGDGALEVHDEVLSQLLFAVGDHELARIGAEALGGGEAGEALVGQVVVELAQVVL